MYCSAKAPACFKPARIIPWARTPYDVVVADINGDGHPDLLVTNEGGFGGGAGTVNVFLGNGNGTFQALPSQSAGAGASGLAVADLNGDKILDLVVTNAFDGTLSLFKGNGDGTFAALT